MRAVSKEQFAKYIEFLKGFTKGYVLEKSIASHKYHKLLSVHVGLMSGIDFVGDSDLTQDCKTIFDLCNIRQKKRVKRVLRNQVKKAHKLAKAEWAKWQASTRKECVKISLERLWSGQEL